MLVDIRMKNVLARKKLEEIRERQYRGTGRHKSVLRRRSKHIKCDGKSVFASVVQQLKDAALKKRRLFGSVIEDLATCSMQQTSMATDTSQQRSCQPPSAG